MSSTDTGAPQAGGTPPVGAEGASGAASPGSEAAGTAAADTTTTGEQQLPEAVREVLAKERKAAREADRRAKAAEARVKEFEDAGKTETERLAQRATDAETASQAATLDLARLRAAIGAVGLPKATVERIRLLAGRLQGDDEAALAKDAEGLAALLQPTEPAAGAFSAGAWGAGTPPKVKPGDGHAAMGAHILDQIQRSKAGRAS